MEIDGRQRTALDVTDGQGDSEAAHVPLKPSLVTSVTAVTFARSLRLSSAAR